MTFYIFPVKISAILGYFLWKIYPARAGFENFCAVLKTHPPTPFL
ncbi:hypothetical protein Cabys_264 [Caldithrix abyssi DSM 13497]|uniref:Uncharacterized protein n=1 Tax=Caldithrix abyssi DSM 13497 TaxID=880073 RepID=A0A1J1C2Y7_CALAY|nr:hypothetical protein Cabys_264 [Caldithrix abyssi DSM 13497]